MIVRIVSYLKLRKLFYCAKRLVPSSRDSFPCSLLPWIVYFFYSSIIEGRRIFISIVPIWEILESKVMKLICRTNNQIQLYSLYVDNGGETSYFWYCGIWSKFHSIPSSFIQCVSSNGGCIRISSLFAIVGWRNRESCCTTEEVPACCGCLCTSPWVVCSNVLSWGSIYTQFWSVIHIIFSNDNYTSFDFGSKSTCIITSIFFCLKEVLHINKYFVLKFISFKLECIPT